MKAWIQRILALLAALLKDAQLPIPKPEPKPEPIAVDAIDPRSIVWDEMRSPALWPITAKITSAAFMHDGVLATHEGTERWPVRQDGGAKPSVGNWWLIAKIDGRWHGATIEWLGVGKNRVSGKRWDGTDDIHGQLSDWRPQSGEVVGIMLSGVCRSAPYTVAERSQIVTVVVP